MEREVQPPLDKGTEEMAMGYEKNITRSILAVHVRRLQGSDIDDEGINSGSDLQRRSIVHHISARDLIFRT